MKNIILLLFLFLTIACSENQNNNQTKGATSKEMNEMSKAVGVALTTNNNQLSEEQQQIKSMLKLIIIDYLKIDTINKSAHLTLTKEKCSKLGLPDTFYEYINKELESTLHAVDSMGVWKEWSETFLELQATKEKNK